MKNKFFQWSWIKNQANHDFKSKALVNLSLEMEEEPNGFSGKLAIYEWLDEIKAPIKYHEMVRQLETEFHNSRSMAIQRILNGPQGKEMGEG